VVRRLARFRQPGIEQRALATWSMSHRASKSMYNVTPTKFGSGAAGGFGGTKGAIRDKRSIAGTARRELKLIRNACAQGGFIPLSARNRPRRRPGPHPAVSGSRLVLPDKLENPNLLSVSLP
jgi:hypothetical protein